MSRNHMIVVFGGHWEGSEYKDGEEDALFIPSGGISYIELLEEIRGIVRSDENNFDYVLHSVIETEEGKKVKIKIRNDSDLQDMLAISHVLKVFVTLKRKHVRASVEANAAPLLNSQSSRQNDQSFVHLMTSQSTYGYQMPGGGVLPTTIGMNYMPYGVPFVEQQMAQYLIPPPPVSYMNQFIPIYVPNTQMQTCVAAAVVHQPEGEHAPHHCEPSLRSTTFIQQQHTHLHQAGHISSPICDQSGLRLSPCVDQMPNVENLNEGVRDWGQNGDRYEEAEHVANQEDDEAEHGHNQEDDHDHADDSSDKDNENEDDENYDKELEHRLVFEFEQWIRGRGKSFVGNPENNPPVEGPSATHPGVLPEAPTNETRESNPSVQGPNHAYPNVCPEVPIEDIDRDCFSSNVMHERRGRNWVIPNASFYARQHMGEYVDPERSNELLYMGATFMSKRALKNAVGFYDVKHKVKSQTERSCKDRLNFNCKFEDCPFQVHAVAKENIWRVIKFVAPHTCKLDLTRNTHRQVPSRIIGAMFASKLLDEGRILRPCDIRKDLQREHGIQVNYNVAHKAKEYAFSLIYGDPDESFQMLPSYLHILRHTNPGTVTSLQLDANKTFQYVFIALGASISGFLHCGRPVIVVDGTHLKGKYKGILFVAATHDGNEQVFPLAVGIGDKESDNSWTWFLTQLRGTYGCPDDLLIVSDQHISIGNSVRAVYPGVPHGYCTYHLRGKVARYGAIMVNMYNRAAYSYRVDEFTRQMDKIKQVNTTAWTYLNDVGSSKWARSMCPVRRYVFMTSNAAECLNGRLRWARKLPVCSLLECFRTIVQQWFYERRTAAEASDNPLTEKATIKLETTVADGGVMVDVQGLSNHTYKVKDGLKSYVVNLGQMSCSCREFDLDLMPCSHATATIRFAGESVYSYVAHYYTMDTLRQMYSGLVMPVPHPDEWDVPTEVRETTVKSPENPRQAGRPKTSRIPSGPESSSSRERRKICSRCRGIGHNRSTCSVYIPLSSTSESNSYDASQMEHDRRRGERRCSNCRGTGHTRRTCRVEAAPTTAAEL